MWAPTDRTLVFPSGRRRAFRFACGSCGVLVDDPAHRAAARSHLEACLSDAPFVPDKVAPYGFDLYTLRTAASRVAKAVDPADPAQAEALRAPHGSLAAAGVLVPLADDGERCISLGILCRPGDLEDVLAGAGIHACWTDDIVVMVDREDEPTGAEPTIRIVARPLSDDFAAQRNALQALAARPWMLQLDADEAIAPETAALLPALTRVADRDGAVSIGLARRNRVDGVVSDLFPDIQYRLNRREVRYAGRVHERPERPWQRSFIALHGAIEHHLDRAHVLSRSQRYEAIDPGRGRLDESEALLRPYRD